MTSVKQEFLPHIDFFYLAIILKPFFLFFRIFGKWKPTNWKMDCIDCSQKIFKYDSQFFEFQSVSKLLWTLRFRINVITKNYSPSIFGYFQKFSEDNVLTFVMLFY